MRTSTKAIYVPKRLVNGSRDMELKKARQLASKAPGYTKTQDVLYHYKSIEFPQVKGYKSGGKTRIIHGGIIAQY